MTAIDRIKGRGRIPRAALYARFSSDNQREESIEAQLRAMHDYCKRNGVAIVEEYCDRARSATTDDRPEFLNMISDSRNGIFDIVVVHKLDRFSRNRYDSAYYKRELKKNDVTLISVLENLDDSPESIILESVLEGMSEYYSKNLGREVMKGMKESARQCRYTGGQVPYGFKVNKETYKFEIEEREAEAVRMIFQGVCDGLGYAEIIDKLNYLGYRNKAGRPFVKNSITEMLRNEKYRGVFIYNRSAGKSLYGTRNHHKSKPDDEIIRIEGGMPRIIDDETFYRVSSIIKSRCHRSTNRSAKEQYLLSGKVVCGYCGSAYTGNCSYNGRNKTKLVTYRCGAKLKRGELHCNGKDINRNYLEQFVVEQISDIIFSEERIPEILSGYENAMSNLNLQSNSQLYSLRQKQQGIQTKIDNIISVIAQSGSSSLLSALDGLEAELSQINASIEELEQSCGYKFIDRKKVIDAYRKAQQMFIAGTLPQRKQLINLYVNKVIVFNEYVRIELNLVPSNLKSTNNTRPTDSSEPCDIHTIISKFSEKNNHGHAKSDKSVIFCGGGDGSRTRVRKPIHTTFYERSLLLRAMPHSLTAVQTNTHLCSVVCDTSIGYRHHRETFTTNRRLFLCRGNHRTDGR